MSSLGTLVFGDEPDGEGWYPVSDEDGRLVASFEIPEPGRSFTARTPDGAVLCSGTPRRLRRAYLVHDAEGRTMVTFRKPVVRISRIVASLADGSRLTLRSPWRVRGSIVEDVEHHRLITIEWPKRRGRPSPMTVRIADQSLPLSMVVALVVGRQQHESGGSIWDYIIDDPQPV